METGFMNRITGLVIALVVGGLLVGGLLIPTMTAVTDAQTVTKTNDYGIFASANANETLTITCEINSDDSSKWDWTVNGETIQFNVTDTNLRPVFLADTFNTYLDNDGDIIVSLYNNARYAGQDALDLSISEGILSGHSYVSGEVTHTFTDIPIEWAFYASDSGDYRSFYLLSGQNFPIYYTDINEIYGSNFIFTTNKFYSFHGTDVSYYATVTTPTHITATVDSEKVNGTVEMQKMDVSRTTGEYTFIIDNNGTDYTAHPYQFIVPAKVQSLASTNSPIYATLFGVVALMGIIALVVVAANAVRNKY